MRLRTSPQRELGNQTLRHPPWKVDSVALRLEFADLKKENNMVKLLFHRVRGSVPVRLGWCLVGHGDPLT